MVPAEVIARDGGLLTMRAGPHILEVVADGQFDRGLVCIRPEDVSLALAAEAGGSARNHLAGRVARIVVTAADARVEVDCGFRLTARITRRSAEELRLAPGASVIATFKATAVHVIPK
jgi:molybdopterin-binding protein